MQASRPTTGLRARPTRRYCAFFVLHYGLFWTVHGIFVFVFFGLVFSSEARGDFDPAGVAIAAGALFLSHGVSYFVNFLGKDEDLTISPDRQMLEPYPRVVVAGAAQDRDRPLGAREGASRGGEESYPAGAWSAGG